MLFFKINFLQLTSFAHYKDIVKEYFIIIVFDHRSTSGYFVDKVSLLLNIKLSTISNIYIIKMLLMYITKLNL